jgi:ribonuclease P protein component
MLPKAARLSVKEFDLVIKEGREAHSPFFSIKYAPAGKLKISATAPKKTFKTAVSRNRTRRRIYASVRQAFPLANIEPQSIVIIVKKDISEIDSASLARMIRELFVQARLTR